MKLAIMQPYFFPYLGYFQLLKAVDTFIVYDDVNFIKRGWINRNSILLNCRAHLFSIPLQKASQSELIFRTKLALDWRKNFLKTIHQAYIKAPQFRKIFPLIEEVVATEHANVAELAISSIKAVNQYVGLAPKIHVSSVNYDNRHLKGQNRILDICKREACKDYFNLPGGRALYSSQDFAEAGINLIFIQPRETSYKQLDCEFVSGLSIIDVLMFNDKKTIGNYLENYELS